MQTHGKQYALRDDRCRHAIQHQPLLLPQVHDSGAQLQTDREHKEHESEFLGKHRNVMRD